MVAGPLGLRRFFYSMCRKVYWPHTAHDVYNSVSNYSTNARNDSQQVLEGNLHILPASGSLEFKAIDMLRPLPCTTKGNPYVVVITNRYRMATKAIPVDNMTATHVANDSLESWTIPYGTLTHVVMDSAVQFTSKQLATLSTMLGVKPLMTTTYYLLTNQHVERHNRTIVTRLRHYVADNR